MLTNSVAPGQYYVFTTSGIAHRLKSSVDENIPAYIEEFADEVSTGMDASCTTSDAEVCVSKGDLVFVEDGNTTDLLNLFTVTKVWLACFSHLAMAKRLEKVIEGKKRCR